MGEQSKIEWTDSTFNPWWGCQKVSPACDRCYAESTSKRYGHSVWGKDSKRRFFSDKHWNGPRKWNAQAEKDGKPTLVFCASMADIGEDRRDLDPHRKRLWALAEETKHLIWLFLTKRADSYGRMLPASWLKNPMPNIWLGITAENQRRLDERMESLAKIKAAVKWVSYEPSLGPIDISEWRDHIGWVIVGGESGAGARPMEEEWATDLLDQCRAYGVSYFMKQLGGFPDKRKLIETFPKELQVREFPAGVKSQN